MNTPETQSGSSLQRVVSVLFGELKLSGCENHPHRLDLSCCKIRQTDGTALTTKQVWEVLNELATAKHANDKTDRRGRSGASELTTDAARPRSVQ